MVKSETQSIRKTVLIGIIGNVLEWYDLIIYGYFSTVIAKLFFPNADPMISLLAAFGVFAAGFIVRPLGAMIFGTLGDRIGRKNSLFLSTLLIAVPTFLIGLLPTYNQIGIVAPILLTVLRLLQGLSVGGEFSSSVVFLTEHAPANRRGFVGSWVFFGSGLGWLFGSLVSACANHLLSPQELLTWGWRFPFIFGLVTGIFGLYIRYFSTETQQFQQMKKTASLSSEPIREVFQSSKKRMGATMGLALLSTIGGYLLYAYMPTYLSHMTGITLADALVINTISLAFFTLLAPMTGWLSDQVGRRRLFLLSSSGLILLTVPLFYLLHQGSFGWSLLAMLILTVLMAMFQGPFPAMMHELFPPRVRASGVGISYNVAAALFAGTAPLMCTLLIKYSGSSFAPAYYLILAASITFGVLVLQRPMFEPQPEQKNA